MKKPDKEGKVKGKTRLQSDVVAEKPTPFPFKNKEILQVKLTCTLENSGAEKVITKHPRITRWLLRIEPKAKVVVNSDDVLTAIVDKFVRKLTPLQTQNANWGMLQIHSTPYVLRPRGVYGLLVDETVPPIDQGDFLCFELFAGNPPLASQSDARALLRTGGLRTPCCQSLLLTGDWLASARLLLGWQGKHVRIGGSS